MCVPSEPGTKLASGTFPGKNALEKLNRLKMLTLGVIVNRLSFGSGIGQASAKSKDFNHGKFSAPGVTDGNVGITQPSAVISAGVKTLLLTSCVPAGVSVPAN